jgi:hypothetical protein
MNAPTVHSNLRNISVTHYRSAHSMTHHNSAFGNIAQAPWWWTSANSNSSTTIHAYAVHHSSFSNKMREHPTLRPGLLRFSSRRSIALFSVEPRVRARWFFWVSPRCSRETARAKYSPRESQRRWP